MPAQERVPVAPFVWAVLMPLVGFVLGVIEASKRSTSRGAAIIAVSIAAGTGWSALAIELTKPKVECSKIIPDYCVQK